MRVWYESSCGIVYELWFVADPMYSSSVLVVLFGWCGSGVCFAAWLRLTDAVRAVRRVALMLLCLCCFSLVWRSACVIFV